MRWLKVIAVMLLCSAFLSQIHCASLHQPNSQPKRQRRMTPFWRGVSSLRPIGASCKDDIECVTMLCRKNDHKMTKQSSFQISENAEQQHGGPGRATVP